MSVFMYHALKSRNRVQCIPQLHVVMILHVLYFFGKPEVDFSVMRATISGRVCMLRRGNETDEDEKDMSIDRQLASSTGLISCDDSWCSDITIKSVLTANGYFGSAASDVIWSLNMQTVELGYSQYQTGLSAIHSGPGPWNWAAKMFSQLFT